jgi:hypothetical protein
VDWRSSTVLREFDLEHFASGAASCLPPFWRPADCSAEIPFYII